MSKWNKSIIKEIQKYKTEKVNSSDATLKALDALTAFVKSLNKFPSETNKVLFITHQMVELLDALKNLNLDSMDKAFIKSKVNSTIFNLQTQHDLNKHAVEGLLLYADSIVEAKKPKEIIEMQDVKLVQQLGKGNFGEVNLYQVVNPEKLKMLQTMGLISKNSNTIAIKTLTSSSPQDISDFKYEGRINGQLYKGRGTYLLNHSQTTCHFNYAVKSHGLGGRELLLSKLESAGSAAQYINKWRAQMNLDAIDAASIKDSILLLVMLISDLWQGMKEIHELGVLHGDLSIYNILIDEIDTETNLVIGKISDFGLSKFYNPNSPNEGVTISKEAKIQIRRANMERLKNLQLTTATDLYGLKVTVMELIAFMAGIDFHSILFSVNPVVYFTQPNPNDLMLKQMADKLKNRLENDTTCPALAFALREMLDHLSDFLSWQDEFTPAEQKRYAETKLVVLDDYDQRVDGIVTRAMSHAATLPSAVNLQDNNNNNNAPRYSLSPHPERKRQESLADEADSRNNTEELPAESDVNRYARSPKLERERQQSRSDEAEMGSRTSDFASSSSTLFANVATTNWDDNNNNNNNNNQSDKAAESPVVAIKTRAKRAVSNAFGRRLSQAVEPLTESRIMELREQHSVAQRDEDNTYDLSPSTRG